MTGLRCCRLLVRDEAGLQTAFAVLAVTPAQPSEQAAPGAVLPAEPLVAQLRAEESLWQLLQAGLVRSQLQCHHPTCGLHGLTPATLSTKRKLPTSISHFRTEPIRHFRDVGQGRPSHAQERVRRAHARSASWDCREAALVVLLRTLELAAAVSAAPSAGPVDSACGGAARAHAHRPPPSHARGRVRVLQAALRLQPMRHVTPTLVWRRRAYVEVVPFMPAWEAVLWHVGFVHDNPQVRELVPGWGCFPWCTGLHVAGCGVQKAD